MTARLSDRRAVFCAQIDASPFAPRLASQSTAKQSDFVDEYPFGNPVLTMVSAWLQS
jgi:hypothetical protein